MPAIDLSVLGIPAECDNIKLPIECEIVLGDLTQLLKSFYHQGFFAVKRRAVFILGEMW